MTFAEAADRLDKEFAYINGCYVDASRPDHEIADAELDVEGYDEALEIAIKLLRETDVAKGVECVTAASTIAALEEAGEKWRAKNREIVKKQVVTKCLEKKKGGWVKTADRMPQDDELPEEDNGMVMCAFLVTGVTAKPFYVFELTRANAIRSYPERTAYWMPIPKLPEVEE